MSDLSRFITSRNNTKRSYSSNLSRFLPSSMKSDKQKDEEILKKRQQFTTSVDQNVSNVGNFMDQVITDKEIKDKQTPNKFFEFQDDTMFQRKQSDLMQLGLVDGAGFPIDNKKEIVTSVDENGFWSAKTEKTATVSANDLGLPIPPPNIDQFYNIPTIINGVEMPVSGATQLIQKKIQSGEINPNDIPNFGTLEEAENQAQIRSDIIGNSRKNEIKDKIIKDQHQAEVNKIVNVFNMPSATIEKAEGLKQININPKSSGINGTYPNYNFYNPVQGNIPIDMSNPKNQEMVAELMIYGNTFQMPDHAFFGRGFARSFSMWAMLGNQLGYVDDKELVATLAEIERITPEMNSTQQSKLKYIMEADGWLESAKRIGDPRNWDVVLAVVGESLPMSLNSLAVFGLTTAVTGNPFIGAGAGGLVTANTVFADSLIQELKEAGIDLQNEESVIQALTDENFMLEARKKSATYSIPIATFDALSMGLAGKLAFSIANKGGSSKAILGALAADTGGQAFLGGAGEYTAQALQKHFGMRDDIIIPEVFLEGIAEIPIGVAEIGISYSNMKRVSNEIKEKNKIKELQIREDFKNVSKLFNANSPLVDENLIDPDVYLETKQTADQLNELEGTTVPSQADVPISAPEQTSEGETKTDEIFTDEQLQKIKEGGGDIRPVEEKFPQEATIEQEEWFAKTKSKFDELAKTVPEAKTYAETFKKYGDGSITMWGGVGANIVRAYSSKEMYADKIKEFESIAKGEPQFEPKGDYFSKFFEPLRSTGSNQEPSKMSTEARYQDSIKNPEIASAFDKAKKYINDLVLEIESLGYDIDNVNTATQAYGGEKGKKAYELKIKVSSITGTVQRLINSSSNLERGYKMKNANPERVKADLANLNVILQLDKNDSWRKFMSMSTIPEDEIETQTEPVETTQTEPVETTETETTTEFPKPNESGVYDKEDVKPNDKFETSVGQIYVLEISKGKWANAINVQFTDSGIGSPITAQSTFPSREAAIKNAITDMRRYIRNENRSDITQKKKKEINGMLKFLDEIETSLSETTTQTQPVKPQTAPVETTTEQFTEENNPQRKDAEGIKEYFIDETIEEEMVTPDRSNTVQVVPVLVDIRELKKASGNLQPRDRNLKESEIEAQKRATPEKFDPKSLITNRTTESGAPIITRDGTVISGNGRILTLRKAMDINQEGYLEYLNTAWNYLGDQEAKKEGGSKTLKMIEFRNQFTREQVPLVLVFKLKNDMTIQELETFADKSNQDSIQRMSGTETAKLDAKRMDLDLIKMFEGGDIFSSANKKFVTRFLKTVIPQSQQGAMTRDGQLTKEAVSRIQNAILATAYDDTTALAKMLDSTDNNVKAISNALLDSAPKYAELKADIASGKIGKQFDITKNITDALNIVSDLKQKNQKVGDFLNQVDFERQLDPTTEELLKAWFNTNLTRQESGNVISNLLKFYVDEAGKKQEGGMFVDETTPGDIITLAKQKAKGVDDGQQQITFDRKKTSTKRTSERNIQDSKQVQQRETKETSTRDQTEDKQTADKRLENATKTEWQDFQTSLESETFERISLTEGDGTRALRSTRKGKSGSLVQKYKERNRQSLKLTAFEAIGLDPREAISRPIEEQFKLLSQAMKDKFGLKAVEKHEKANAKEAVDQLLDGFHNLSVLTQALQLPDQAIGLDGTLSFVALRNAGFYGAYFPDLKEIRIPARVNSFAHEWIHAFDAFMYMRYGNQGDGTVNYASDAVRQGVGFRDGTPQAIRVAYQALMQRIFFDKADVAQKIRQIDEEIDKLYSKMRNPNKPPKRIEELERQRKRLVEGGAKTTKNLPPSRLRQETLTYADITKQDKAYWGSPRELIARVGEAYLSNLLIQQGIETEMLGAGEGYLITLEDLGVNMDQILGNEKIDPNNEVLDNLRWQEAVMDSRMALTFPKENDRKEMFDAFQDLFNAVVREQVFSGAPGLGAGDTQVFDLRNWHKVANKDEKNFIQRAWNSEMRSVRSQKAFNAKIAKLPKRINSDVTLKPSMFKNLEDRFLFPVLYAKQDIIKTIIRRYEKDSGARKVLEEVYNRLGTDVGGEMKVTFRGGSINEGQDAEVKRKSQIFKKIIDKFNLDLMSEEENNFLRGVLTSDETIQENSNLSETKKENLLNAARDIRFYLNGMYDYLRSSGLDIGYAKSGYLQRTVDSAKVNNDRKGFKKQATKVYKIVFEEEHGKMDVEDVDQMIAVLKTARKGKYRKHIDFTEESIVGQFREIVKVIVDAQEQIEALENPKEGAEVTLSEEEIAEKILEQQEIIAEHKDLVKEFYPQAYAEIRSVYSQVDALAYRQAIEEGEINDPETYRPSNSFLKKRKLPKEADHLLNDFYNNDVLENVLTYTLGAIRKGEYSKRFGYHLVPKGFKKDKKTGLRKDYLDYLLKDVALNKGVNPDDINNLLQASRAIVGVPNKNNMGSTLTDYITALTAVTLLVRAPIASIAEPFTVAIQAQSTAKGLKAFMLTLENIIPKTANRREALEQRRQFARILGVIEESGVSQLMSNRIGGGFENNPRLQRAVTGFFTKIGLAGLTNWQRVSASRIGFQLMTELARQYKKPVSSKEKVRAEKDLNQFGIPTEELQEFSDFILSFNDKLPTEIDIMNEDTTLTPMGQRLATAILRFADTSVQNPKMADRPLYAETSIGRMSFGIMSFIYAFHNNVLKGMGRRIQREVKDNGAISTLTYGSLAIALPVMSLYTAHTLVSTARELIFNRDRYDREWEENDEDATKFLLNYILPLGFVRSGFTGRYDPIYQMLTGLKYQRDISNIFVGAGMSYFFDNVAKVLAPFTRPNSPNTSAAEFNALLGLYNLTLQPIMSYSLAVSPLGQLGSYAGTGALMYGSSQDFKNKFINSILGLAGYEPYERGTRGRRKKSQSYP